VSDVRDLDDAPAERVATAVVASRRYRGLDAELVRRVTAEELPRAGNEADAVKRVRRRLHQAVAAYRSAPRDGSGALDLARLESAWKGRLGDPAFRDACATVLRRHASTRERLPHLEHYFPRLWELTGEPPQRIADLGCGLGPLALPWMGLPAGAHYLAVDVDTAQLDLADRFLALVGQPHRVVAADLAATDLVPDTLVGERVDVAFLLKLVPLLDRRDRAAAGRLLGALDARDAVVSFPVRSLGGRGKGMERTYRERLTGLVAALGDRVNAVTEASIPGELVFVLRLAERGSRG